MAWETRRNGRRYYYRSKRVGGRVVKEYLGGGAWINSMLWLEGRDRERAAEEQAQSKAERAKADELDAAVVEFCRFVDEVTREALTAAGYHRHDRGQWRKRRRNGEDGVR